LRVDPDNPARPRRAALCALDEIPSPGSKGFRWREGDALFAGFVVRSGERVVGYVDGCPHAGWPLAGFAGRYLTRENDLILCAGHAACSGSSMGLRRRSLSRRQAFSVAGRGPRRTDRRL
jgi:nitrite reductase/ring-hydroxylating ferredoxin subunit